MKVVIPAAGLGTRFRPWTLASPKELLPVGTRPIIDYVIREAVDAGADDILVVTGHGKQALEDYLARMDVPATIHFTRQKEPLGLGHAIGLARKHVGDEPFGVLLGDTIHQKVAPGSYPALRQLEMLPHEPNEAVLAVEWVPAHKVQFYGIAENLEKHPTFPQAWRAHRLVEKPKPEDTSSRLGLTGAYLLPPSVFDLLDVVPRGRNNEFQLTDALQMLADVGKVWVHEFVGTRYDIGDPPGWLAANHAFAGGMAGNK